MRLLNVHNLEFAVFHDGEIPEYVVVSHRWKAGTEVTFKEVQKGRGVEKSGYQKILGLAKYIKTHIPSCAWMWIDTCRIDDRSSQEVSEAINSMFKWYSNAKLCLAYLADVNSSDTDQYCASEWFTRGWTLQELIASPTVIFLTRSWQVIGHKGKERCPWTNLDFGQSLVEVTSSRTMIPADILLDHRRSGNLGVEEKLKWMEGRKTTREEDAWYCLFGIFDVAIGANYGEGAEKAKRRFWKEVSIDTKLVDSSPGPSTLPKEVAKLQSEGERRQFIHRKIKGSLYFPQLEDRRSQIHAAHANTFHWALLSPTGNTAWDSLPEWLQSQLPRDSIYWINAKPGAGKSCLVRSLDSKVHARDLSAWATEKDILMIRYYFWSAGTDLQKTLVGFLRTILHQLLNQASDWFSQCIPSGQWTAAESGSAAVIPWTETELRECLKKFISMTSSCTKIFGLVDGLDEIEGGDDAQNELINVLEEMTQYGNVKLCVSSRPYAIFQDAFATYPQLRLHELNAQDIAAYVESELQRQYRYRQMLISNPEVGNIVRKITVKAQGVFLWTRLVVKELLHRISLGDNYEQLQGKLRGIPADMGRYFQQIMASTEPHDRRDSSAFLQVTSYDESEFISLTPIRLIDLIFTADAGRDFSLSGNDDLRKSLLSNPGTLISLLETTLRRVLTVCRGLLECHFDPGGDPSGEAVDIPAEMAISTLPDEVVSKILVQPSLAFSFRVGLMHRSLHDFLLEPETQHSLHRHTDGPLDVRNYLRNARLVQIHMVKHAGWKHPVAVGLGSYLFCSLRAAGFRPESRCVDFIRRFSPATNYVLMNQSAGEDYWFIQRSLECWHREGSSLLTMAIDFGLTEYVIRTTTSRDVTEKLGRPLLDYALRPRFGGDPSEQSTGNQYPDSKLVRKILSLGADPNELVRGVPMWSLFLSFIADLSPFYTSSATAMSSCLECLEAMMMAGAATTVTKSDLSKLTSFGCFGHMYLPARLDYRMNAHGNHRMTARGVFVARWQPLSVDERPTPGQLDPTFAISDVLECLRPTFGDAIDGLKRLASSKTSIQRHDHVEI